MQSKPEIKSFIAVNRKNDFVVVHHFEIPGVKILPLRHKDAKNEYLLSLRLSAFAVINSNRCSTDFVDTASISRKAAK